MNRPPHVVAVGEVLWDLFPDGARFGGAPANFAHHAAALGADVWMMTGVGSDDLGKEALARLESSGLRLDLVTVDENHPTGRVQVNLNDRGEASYQFGQDEAWDHIEWSSRAAEVARSSDAVCFGTLGQRNPQSRELISRLVQETPEDSLRVLDLNLRPPFDVPEVIHASLKIANVLKINDDELSVLSDLLGLQGVGEVEQVEELARRSGFVAIALTLGDRGAIVHRDGETVVVESQPVSVVDTVGAGDSFTAAFVMGLLAKADLDLIARSACRVAEFVCSHAGATPELIPQARPPYCPG